MASSNNRKSREELIQECEEVCLRNKNVISDKPLEIGPLDNYDKNQMFEFDSKSFKIIIENGIIYVVPTVSEIHQKSITYVSQNVSKSLQKHAEFFNFANEVKVINEHGCKAIFGKQPDAAFHVADEFVQQRKQPPLLIEIAVNHESLGEIVLNQGTHVNYILMVKVFMQGDQFRAISFLARRRESQPEFFYETEEEQDQHLEKLQKKFNAKTTKGKDSVCADYPVMHDFEEADKKLFDMDILFYREVTDDEFDATNGQFTGGDMYLNLDARRVFSGTTITYLEDAQLQIVIEALTWTRIRNLWNNAKKNLEKKKEKPKSTKND